MARRVPAEEWWKQLVADGANVRHVDSAGGLRRDGIVVVERLQQVFDPLRRLARIVITEERPAEESVAVADS